MFVRKEIVISVTFSSEFPELRFHARRIRKNNAIVFASGRDIKERGDSSATSRLCMFHSPSPLQNYESQVAVRDESWNSGWHVCIKFSLGQSGTMLRGCVAELCVDGVYGHQFLARENVAVSLSQKVCDGTISLNRAKEIAKWLFTDNPKRLFNPDNE